MEHDIHTVDQRLDVVGPKVGLDQLESIGLTRRREVRVLGGAVVVRREAVDADDLVATSKQRVGEGGADEAGDASDEGAHRAPTTRTRRGRTARPTARR